ncbi:MAG TPA: putative glycolipid-binding domain-containing protein [Pseudonocardia sp.]|nr:putative glycolipid-binding domain-containing protein [Pseudonocardia sp.]
MTTLITWQADGATGLEGTRLLLGAGGMRALGRMVRADGTSAFTASYRLVVAEDGTLQRMSVSSATAERERHLTLNRTEDGYWLLDTGGEGRRSEFEGAVDADLAFSPVFNSLPVRRLGLHRDAGEHLLKVVFVALPELTVEVVEQSYRTVSTLDAGRAVVGFSSAGFESEIEFDADGVVTAYPGIARRLPEDGAAAG